MVEPFGRWFLFPVLLLYPGSPRFATVESVLASEDDMSREPRIELLALLDDVKANPDDLTPWLVLCDWLEENGDEADRARSEYCRLCFDKLGKQTYASDWEKGERRRELFRTYKQTWFGPILALRPTMQKGLAVIEGCSIDDVLQNLPGLLEVEEAWAWISSMNVWNHGRWRGKAKFMATLKKRQYYAALKVLAALT
jgi:uncharacterized protein (TIGR02996 family)